MVIDNDGGGIFDFLPQRSALPIERYEQLFGTPHGTDIAALASAHGLPAVTASTLVELRAAVSRPGPSLTRVASERTANVQVHARLNP